MSILSFRRKESDCSSATTLVTTTTIKNDVDDPRGSLGLNLLSSPSEPDVDFIFVHGLGGGSRKTWSKTSSIAHFWPQQWLPKDPAFNSVRIHSFGYDSDWVKGKENRLNIHHFGKSLLGELSTSPYLSNANTSIVLIGHSMGGLVIKKAHMLARQASGYEALAERLHTIFFLATPHRGSDSAKLLNNILHMTYSSRAYVAELERGSGAIQSINDEFRKYSADIVLWSFYETQMLKLGLLSSLIVDPDSATLGYPDEKQMPMNADHRSICKFDTTTDPNYVILRNALASTVDSITKRVVKSKAKSRRKQLEDLRCYLEVSEKLEDDLVAVDEARMSGTCRWFSAKENYIKCSGSSPEAPHILWVHGRPAAGKSVLAGYVIRQLQERNANCSYFFFKHGDKSKSRLAACFRSLAFQMACSNSQIREVLLEMLYDGTRLEIDNERTLWQRLFLSGILQTSFHRYYWVIDALDECTNFASLFASTLLKLDGSTPLRMLITSRSTADLEKRFSTLDPRWVLSERIATRDTLPDIERLVEASAESVLVKDDRDRAVLVEKILRKAEGCFLWTVLVLRELSASYGEEEINQALEDMPRDMEPLYRRTLESMTLAAGGRKLTKAILTWATCATRPLTTKELEGALRLDIKDNFPKIEECILAVCGHLVTVDRFGRVQMVHETAREFLLSDLLDSEFAINKKEAHTRIARACLTYLSGEELKPPRTGRRFSTMNAVCKRAEFSTYACSEFSYHLAKADPLANDIWVLVNKFLQSNVLSWIEIVAETRNFNPLIRAAKHPQGLS